MNIGQLLRSMIGEGQPAEPKTLELKAGQVVKGMVLRLLAEQQAMVSIDGVTVKARLEAPLKAGEATWLQVQPSPDGGPLVLSPAANGNAIVEGRNP
ncbi:hypothetical protein N6H14_24460 [Paenibacillus sp. CC-CFT747]|nr:hypothetical protein N6H14_24460 [Paenibacillus sp. CC-CFT747]